MIEREKKLSRFKQFAFGIGLTAVLVSTGCQVNVGGQTLPSPFYLDDDIQYFPAGPEFKLTEEAKAMQELQSDSTPLAP